MTPSDLPPAVVVKLGGAIVSDLEAVATLWASVRALCEGGTHVVIVHGGGPQSTELARRLGHEPRIVAGRRVTSDLDLDVALYVLRGAVNARLAAAAQGAGLAAVGIAAGDGFTVRVQRRPPLEVDGETVDFGHVGDVVSADGTLVRTLLDAGFVPVVAPICADASGRVFNVNADTVASEIAAALGAQRLDLVTETGGVRCDAADPASLLSRLTEAEVEAGVAAGWIAGGMRPKLEVARAALRRGVPAVRVCALADVAGEGGTTVVP
ncbi:MAG: acetylglutamate kinase [Bacteroidota bacterium]